MLASASRGSRLTVTRMPQLRACWRMTRVTVEESSTTSMLRPSRMPGSAGSPLSSLAAAGSGRLIQHTVPWRRLSRRPHSPFMVSVSCRAMDKLSDVPFSCASVVVWISGARNSPQCCSAEPSSSKRIWLARPEVSRDTSTTISPSVPSRMQVPRMLVRVWRSLFGSPSTRAGTLV